MLSRRWLPDGTVPSVGWSSAKLAVKLGWLWKMVTACRRSDERWLARKRALVAVSAGTLRIPILLRSSHGTERSKSVGARNCFMSVHYCSVRPLIWAYHMSSASIKLDGARLRVCFPGSHPLASSEQSPRRNQVSSSSSSSPSRIFSPKLPKLASLG